MKEAFLVFAGGGAGSLLRYWISKTALYNPESLFMWHTFAVNIAGSFMLGLLFGYFAPTNDDGNLNLRLLLGVGFCGGFTTFSAFAYENVQLLQNNQPMAFLLYTTASMFAGFLAMAAGLFLVKYFA